MEEAEEQGRRCREGNKRRIAQPFSRRGEGGEQLTQPRRCSSGFARLHLLLHPHSLDWLSVQPRLGLIADSTCCSLVGSAMTRYMLFRECHRINMVLHEKKTEVLIHRHPDYWPGPFTTFFAPFPRSGPSPICLLNDFRGTSRIRV